MAPCNPDFRPTANWANLRLRAELLRKTREFFHDRGFLEVETPLLSADVVVDRHLDPIPVTLADDPCRPNIGRRMWLQTSPEFGMKRLLAAGAPAIYQITRAFRNAEIGPLHNPEFTMLEWYRAGDGMHEGMALLGELCECLLARGSVERMSYGDAFARHVGVDPHCASIADLRAAADRYGGVAPAGLGDDRDGWLDLLLVERVQPHLGRPRPTILFDYPASQAALARIREQPRPVAERFELYVDGVELANGYHELLDAAVLRQRIAAANVRRAADGKPQLPSESRLLDAMEAGLPPCSGVALGFDRLVMVAAGARTLAEVMPFPIDRA
ncbi:MAG TPA: EF-P lysine aminoacylase EpmA [Pirellulales bacterium]|jgi:lysyl-tRNA synthetase class 2|nr:EF-P lysine aminoacylase EpmA [Pirellulales bacterium]